MASSVTGGSGVQVDNLGGGVFQVTVQETGATFQITLDSSSSGVSSVKVNGGTAQTGDVDLTPLVTAIAANGGSDESGRISLNDGTNVTIVDAGGGNFTINATGGGGSVEVTDGTTTVNPATEINFTSGAVVTDLTGGVAGVAIDVNAAIGGDANWIAFPALVNSWADQGAPYGALGYRKDGNGFVHLRGALDGSGATNQVISTAGMPVGYRPANDVALPTKGRGDGSGAFVLIIKADGTIQISDNIATQGNSTSGSPACALDGLSYFVGPVGYIATGDALWTDATLAGAWTSNTTSAAYPNVGFRKDASGVVHFRGMATTGAAALIFTLPSGYRPDHDVWLPTVDGSGANGIFIKASDGTVQTAVNADGTGGSGATNLRLDGLTFFAA
jgi:hypothetical protein